MPELLLNESWRLPCTSSRVKQDNRRIRNGSMSWLWREKRAAERRPSVTTRSPIGIGQDKHPFQRGPYPHPQYELSDSTRNEHLPNGPRFFIEKNLCCEVTSPMIFQESTVENDHRFILQLALFNDYFCIVGDFHLSP